ncbi:hypothetical protein CLAFUW4_11101 [Fulvia fulva]|uniref:Vegetative incompatibility protein HET-E-1 n=1 Tax=Passalora fulva TaxID=5499 RepID=A0A9Q8PCK7_PASFU|nr:Vegetative incompatibility protein HET-E-1 [Fulvia fulva]KAK4620010.1 hypothetical protein CLAFUR4_11106 [Fulvia fulva]KAK4621176.1 hypothetical protein CLAFUR0_11112 [Fulvia fulva]UJO19950.1 Vegetative incompatibility protein HET-E-1 [Fulvia fulva]WPV17284.1 hypothetical protein CLAFUW4_11101 [Fulvia fulva]
MIRLINASSLYFDEFEGDFVPPYAVLSHRWGARKDEVTSEDFQSGLKKDSPGFKKIDQFCKHASDTGRKWVWVDTCCIDKKSSAELSESISSMFSWYQKADICFAYLQHVENAETWRESAWWKRGWTLQELIAPDNVVFCDRAWREIGSKHGMANDIATLANIPPRVLKVRGRYRHYTVAQKLSWAAGRATTKPEDRAYSLLGLFHINMPLLYGEGTSAFQRLQIEILQKYSDESLFAWSRSSKGPHLVLAHTPDSFQGCGDMAPLSLQEESESYARHQRRRA